MFPRLSCDHTSTESFADYDGLTFWRGAPVLHMQCWCEFTGKKQPWLKTPNNNEKVHYGFFGKISQHDVLLEHQNQEGPKKAYPILVAMALKFITVHEQKWLTCHLFGHYCP